MEFIKRAWAEVDIDKIKYNFDNIKKAAQGREIFAVIKADAYGHGAEVFVQTYEKLGVGGYCVSNVYEALAVRKTAKDTPILILGYTPVENIEILCDNNISQAIINETYAKELSQKLEELNKTLSCHIKIDTGMSRVGLNCQTPKNVVESINKIKEIADFKGINIEGIFTHFSSADGTKAQDKQFTEQQYELFKSVYNNCGIPFKYIHCCNSAGTVVLKENCGNTVRPGIILYGLTPAPDLEIPIDLSPVLSLKSTVGMIKNSEIGNQFSYGRTYKAENPLKVATIPIGYADGYPRYLSNKGKVLINGQFANIIGRVCMDQILVDVTDIKNVNVGDTVTLIGKDGQNEITADDIAKIGNTINYEIVCGISQRIPRIYIENGKSVKYMNYSLAEGIK